MRPNLKWSDGQPLTSEDVAFTINRSREEEWLNYTSVVANLPARAPRRPHARRTHLGARPEAARRSTSTSCPSTSGPSSTQDRSTKYDGNDGVGSGPFVLERLEKGQFARFRANPNYWGGRPAVDRVVLRKFNNPDAMVAALKRGEIDAAEDLPGTRSSSSRRTPRSRRSRATRAR